MGKGQFDKSNSIKNIQISENAHLTPHDSRLRFTPHDSRLTK